MKAVSSRSFNDLVSLFECVERAQFALDYLARAAVPSIERFERLKCKMSLQD